MAVTAGKYAGGIRDAIKPELFAFVDFVNIMAYDDFNKMDMNLISKYIDANAVDHTPFTPDQKPGLEGFKQIFGMLFKAFPDFRQEIIDLIVSPDGKKASVVVRITGTFKGEFMGMKPNGNKLDILGIDNFNFNGDKMIDHWGFVDSDTMMKQLGMTK